MPSVMAADSSFIESLNALGLILLNLTENWSCGEIPLILCAWHRLGQSSDETPLARCYAYHAVTYTSAASDKGARIKGDEEAK